MLQAGDVEAGVVWKLLTGLGFDAAGEDVFFADAGDPELGALFDELLELRRKAADLILEFLQLAARKPACEDSVLD